MAAPGLPSVLFTAGGSGVLSVFAVFGSPLLLGGPMLLMVCGAAPVLGVAGPPGRRVVWPSLQRPAPPGLPGHAARFRSPDAGSSLLSRYQPSGSSLSAATIFGSVSRSDRFGSHARSARARPMSSA